ncbi:squalene synthase HpnC [Inhella inkyongensis]|uniref:Squalene synthase HpnC n=1 Tax=Inhella inkyongensis TaxID=392593 RepID=A0A840S8L2_9BURK|nr:squalene synthase HpnC [Inhella inkyongensis]MBB5205848.1 squalene synthase HpnC [Inhella inkyongensis]
MPTAPLRHHDENFPVASWLCPARLRPPILAIYRFARYADDVADEGDASPAQRQAELTELRASLDAIAQGLPPSPAHAQLMAPLAEAIEEHALPLAPLHALLDAFVQDTEVLRYENRAALLDYCRRSANPVGRLLLHLVGVQGPTAWAASDAICTGLQLVNFWQDIGVDRLKGRVYLPADALAARGLQPEAILAGQDSPALRACVGEQTRWAEALLRQGRALPPLVPGRLAWELRLVIEGGLRIAEKIHHLDHDSLNRRPRLRAWDAPQMLIRALRQRPE